MKSGEPAAVRFRTPVDREIAFTDLVRGEIRFHTDVIGDQVLLRSDGHPAYNFAVVVDDGLMGVTHVVRGEDHISNTPRQLLIYEALGFTPPAFAHVAMVLGPDHTKLSKRHGAVSVDEFRAKGYLPEALLNYLALLSWSPGENQEVVPLAEMAKRFSLSDVGHSASVFDEEKLAWVNRHYLKEADHERLTRLSMPYLERAGYITGRLKPAGFAYLSSLVPLFNTSVDRLEQVPGRLRQLFQFSAAAALEDAAIRQEVTEGPRPTGDRGAGRRAGVCAAARRQGDVPRRRRSREAEDRAERARVVSSDQNRADRRGRRTGARSARAGHGARCGSGFVCGHRRASSAPESARRISMRIYGINAVAEALKAGRVVSMRAGRRHDQRLQQLLALAEQASVPVRRVSDQELDRESGGSSHQGVIADVSERRVYELHDLIEDAQANPPALIVVLDGIEDPHNFGAILRTCDAVGAHGVVRQTRHAAPLTGATSKASAGARGAREDRRRRECGPRCGGVEGGRHLDCRPRGRRAGSVR